MGRGRSSTPSSLLRRRVEIDLHVGVWKDHRADVSSFHHHPATIANLPLTLDQDGAYFRQSGHACGPPVDLGRANRLCDIDAVYGDPRSRNIDLGAIRQPSDRLLIVKRDVSLDCAQANWTVHVAAC